MPGRFNPSEYETVKERKKRFYADHPTGCIHVELLSPPDRATEYVLIRASIWRKAEDMHAGHPPDAQGMSLSIAGGKGADADAWTENAEESAVGRALDNLGYSGNNRCSREEMEKAERHAQMRADDVKSNGDGLSKALRHVWAVANERGLGEDEVHVLAYAAYKVLSLKELTPEQVKSFAKRLREASDEKLRSAIEKHAEAWVEAKSSEEVA